ncbi:MAG: hypothetical protein ACFFD4_06380 [Candidatus Odinarchaeota archaeon]
MTLPNTSSYSPVSPAGDPFVHHVLLSWIVTLLFGMETNANVKLDRLSLYNNLLSLMDGGLLWQHVDRTVVTVLIQRYLDKLVEKGFLEEEEDGYILTESGRVLGNLKYRSLKKKLLEATAK